MTFANTIDKRMPACYKAEDCRKVSNGVFKVRLVSKCGEDMVNDGSGSFGEREVRIAFDGEAYYLQ